MKIERIKKLKSNAIVDHASGDRIVGFADLEQIDNIIRKLNQLIDAHNTKEDKKGGD